MNGPLIHHPAGFPRGWTAVTEASTLGGTGMDFGILKLDAYERWEMTAHQEAAYLLMQGRITFGWESSSQVAERSSVFEENPTVLHVPARIPVWIEAHEACELAVCRTDNASGFDPILFDAGSMCEVEHRGKGSLGDTAHRIVRTVFDKRNRPDSNLVLGEVINFPGRWSSYPPHHHPQPEIYHYRFTDPQGYGHGELGDEVYKLRQYDTLLIQDEKDHAQTSAPGYGMYYLWVIRHLEGAPYVVPEFTAEHSWANEPGAQGWIPPQLEPGNDD